MKDMHHRIRVSSGTLRALSVIVSVVNTFLALRRRRGPKLSRDEIEVERGRAERIINLSHRATNGGRRTR